MREFKFRRWNKLGHMEPIVCPESGDMQFTGLLDKNGVEIYEGDIVKLRFREVGDVYSYEPGVIKWHQPSSAFKWFNAEEDPSDANNYWLSQADQDWREVIGNIYENPELIK